MRELIQLEWGQIPEKNEQALLLLTQEETDRYLTKESCPMHCRMVYLGGDVLLTGAQEALVRERNIEVVTVPEYFYSELEG